MKKYELLQRGLNPEDIGRCERCGDKDGIDRWGSNDAASSPYFICDNCYEGRARIAEQANIKKEETEAIKRVIRTFTLKSEQHFIDMKHRFYQKDITGVVYGFRGLPNKFMSHYPPVWEDEIGLIPLVYPVLSFEERPEIDLRHYKDITTFKEAKEVLNISKKLYQYLFQLNIETGANFLEFNELPKNNRKWVEDEVNRINLQNLKALLLKKQKTAIEESLL